MTDRVNALTVLLDEDIREDDVEHIVHAIRMIKRVGDVKLHVTDVNSAVAEMRVREEYRKKIFGIFYENQSSGS